MYFQTFATEHFTYASLGISPQPMLEMDWSTHDRPGLTCMAFTTNHKTFVNFVNIKLYIINAIKINVITFVNKN